MQSGRGGMGSHKHGVSGCRNGNGKSPRFKHWMKRMAEAAERDRRDRSRIIDPKSSVQELFKEK